MNYSILTGVIQLNNGLFRLNENIVPSTGTQIIIIWCVTAIATTSVISGLRVGIKVIESLYISNVKDVLSPLASITKS